MDSEKRKDLEEAYEKLLAITLNQAPLDGIEDLVVPDVMGFGTTLDEKIHDLEGYFNLIRGQEEEAKNAGLDFHFEPERIHQRISTAKDAALFVEQIIATLKSEGEIVHQFNVRFSALMELIDGQWKLVHWHCSVPTETENDTWHIKKFEKERIRLEKLVAEQTSDLQQKNRELEIDAATQRVRAVAMGMQQPDDIMRVLNIIKGEVEKFELENIGTWFWIFNEDNTLTQWDISEIDLNGTLANLNVTLDLKKSESSKRHVPKWDSTDYYTMPWKGKELQGLINEVKELDPNNGQMFQEAVDTGRMDTYWQACAPFSIGVLGLDYSFEPPESAKLILTKIASAFDMAFQRFEDLKKVEAQARESKIEAALERVRSRTMSMQNSDELADVGLVLFQQIEKAIGLNPESSWITFIDPDKNTMEIWVTHGDKFIKPKRVSARDHENFEREIVAWKSGEESIQITLPKEDFIQAVKKNFGMEVSDKKECTDFYVLNIRHNYGFLGIGAWNLVSDENIMIYQRFAKVFQQTYTRFLDLQKAEQQAYESKVEASLERVRGMAAAMNHSDDLMQIAEEMFKELEILKINPLRYGIGMIDGEKQEAELWASTVNDGHYLDMLGTLSLTWHPMLKQVLDAWNAKLDEVVYELKGKELSDYYQKIGEINPDIPNLDSLQDPKTEIVQFVSFFPFKSGALYAYTDGEPNEEGKSILKRFANVFEQAHIRYNDLQKAEKQAKLIREERDRLEIALKELRTTQDQLVQQEKLASLGQLTAGIAHEIKNPLNFVNNFSEVSLEMVEEARVELSALSSQLSADDSGKVEEALEVLGDIEMNLHKIHEHGSRADSIVKSMLQHSRGGDGKKEPTPLNPLIKEYVNLAFHGMMAGKEPINMDINLLLDENIGEALLIADDFSRLILNLCNNAFDAMREKINSESKIQNSKYLPKLTVCTKSLDGKVVIEVQDNGEGIPDEIKDKIMQPFFTTKKGTAGTGLGLSISNDIVKAHGGSMDFHSQPGQTVFIIKLKRL